MTFENFVNRWWEWIVASSWQLAILIGLITLLTRCLQNASRDCDMDCGSLYC